MAIFGPREIMQSEQIKAKEGNMNADREAQRSEHPNEVNRPPDAFDWGDLATPELYLAWWETLTPEEQAQERAMRDQHGY